MAIHKIFNVVLGVITFALAIVALIYGYTYTMMAKKEVKLGKQLGTYELLDKKIKDKYDVTFKFYNLTITIAVLSALLVGLSVLSINTKSKALGGIKLLLSISLFIVSVMLTYYGRISLSEVYPVEMDTYARYGFASGIVAIFATVSAVIAAVRMLMK